MESESSTGLSSSAESRPATLWVRYVDDVFAIRPLGDQSLKLFHEHLNRQHRAIQFTIEEELDGKNSFLDVLVEKQGHWCMDIGVPEEDAYRPLHQLQIPPPS